MSPERFYATDLPCHWQRSVFWQGNPVFEPIYERIYPANRFTLPNTPLPYVVGWVVGGGIDDRSIGETHA
jgi:hypothetical protein